MLNHKFLSILGTIFMSLHITGAALAADATMYRLPNGLTVMLQDDKRFPLVSMRLYVHAGSAYETPKEAGISHLLEHMVFQGTTTRGTGDISKEIEAMGGYLNAATSFDYTVYITDLPSENWRTGLDVLKDMAFNASVDAKALESEKEVVIAELKRGEDSPSNKLFQQLQTSTLAATPYKHPIIGYEDVIRSITREDILDYVARHYQPQSMLLLVVGDIDDKAMRAEIEKLYGGLKNTRGYAVPEAVSIASLPQNSPVIHIERGHWNKIYMGMAFPVVGQRDAQTVQIDVLVSLLGGGKTSYLYRKYKYDLQLVDSISMSNYSFERIGLLYLTAVLDEDKFPAFWAELNKDLANADNISFTQEELERIKINTENDLFRSKETLSGLASKLGYFTFFDQGEHGEANYLFALQQTTLEELKGKMSGILDRERMSVAILTPENAPKGLNETSVRKTLDKSWPAVKTAQKKEKAKASVEGPEIINIGKGRTLILQADNTLPYISGSLMFTGGDALLDEQVQGLASVTASVLTKGTADLNATEVEDYLADRASSLGTGAGRQSFSLSFTCPERFSGDIFSLLQDTMTRPAFRSEEFNRVKQNQVSAIKSSEDQPLGLAFRHLFPFLFGQHSYGYLQLGTIEEVDKFKVEQAIAYWNIQKEQPWVLSICGNFDREAVIAAAKRLPSPRGRQLSIDAPEWGKEKELIMHLPGRQQSHVLLVFPTAEIGSDDAPALNLLQSVLSGMSGILFTELRDKQGLGYTVTAMPWVSQKAGMLIFYIGTEPDKVEQAKKGFVDVVNSVLANPLPGDMLERGKSGIRGDYYRGMQSLGARSGEAATLFTLGLPLDSSRKEIEQVAKITPEQLQKIAIKYLDLNKAYWVEVQP